MIMLAILDDLRDGGDDDELDDEQIMNAIRRQDEKVVKTAEIAEELPITQNWTNKRLNKLESKGRVHSKSAGRGRVWWPDDAEPESPVAESIGDLVWYGSQSGELAKNLWLMSAVSFLMGGVLMIPILLLGLYPPLSVVPFAQADFATAAMVLALIGSALLVVGGAFKLISLGVLRHYSLE
jgi:hypothetical protein